MSLSASKIRAVMEKRPAAIREFYFEGEFDSPVCCAVRHLADVEILKILLQGGADARAMDVKGFNPLTLLCDGVARIIEARAHVREAFGERCLFSGDRGAFESLFDQQTPEEKAFRMAAVLLAWGCNAEECDAKGRTAVEVAYAGGRACQRLANLCENYLGAQATHVILRASRSPAAAFEGARLRSLRSLPPEVAELVCDFLVPQDICRRIERGCLETTSR